MINLLIGLNTLTNHPTITRRIEHLPVRHRLEPHQLSSDVIESVLKRCNVRGISAMVVCETRDFPAVDSTQPRIDFPSDPLSIWERQRAITHYKKWRARLGPRPYRLETEE